MQRTETRPILVTYCDECGDEVKGNYTILRAGDGTERHACDKWNEAEQARCQDLFSRKLVAEVRAQREAQAQTQG